MPVRCFHFFAGSALGLCAVLSPTAFASDGAKTVDFQKLEFKHGKSSSLAEAQVAGGSRMLILHQPEPLNPPSAWTGPVELRAGSRHCKADYVVVTDVYAAATAPYLVLVTFSKNESIVRFMDASSCREAHKPIRAISEAITLSGSRLEIKPACPDATAKCAGPQVYQLYPDGAPKAVR